MIRKKRLDGILIAAMMIFSMKEIASCILPCVRKKYITSSGYVMVVITVHIGSNHYQRYSSLFRWGFINSAQGYLGFDFLGACANISRIKILIIWYENQSVSWKTHVLRRIYSSKVTLRQSFSMIS